MPTSTRMSIGSTCTNVVFKSMPYTASSNVVAALHVQMLYLNTGEWTTMVR